MTYRLLQRSSILAVGIGMLLCPSWGQEDGPARDTADLLAQGADLATSGRLAEAEIPLVQAATQSPDNAGVLSELAKVEGRLGRKARALELFKQVVSLQGSSADAHLNLGLALADNGQTEEAVLEVSKSLGLDHSNAKSFLIRGQFLSDLKRTKEAAADFSMATRLSPDSADAWLYWATMEFQQEDFAKASGLLEHVVALQPKNTEALILLGRSFLGESRPVAACDAFRRVLAIDPDNSEVIYSLSQALRHSNPSESQRLVKRFQSLHEEKVRNDQMLETIRGLGNRSIVATEHQDWKAAADLLQHAITLCGQCPLLGDLHKDLGLNACHSGDLNTGDRELREALRLKPTDMDIVTALHWIEQQHTNH